MRKVGERKESVCACAEAEIERLSWLECAGKNPFGLNSAGSELLTGDLAVAIGIVVAVVVRGASDEYKEKCY